MDVPTKKNSRWSRAPRPSRGKLKLTERDHELLKLLYRFRYLPSNDIHAWLGGNYDWTRKRLDQLYDEPYCFLGRPPQQRENANANYTHLIYELDTPGATVLRDLGMPKWEKVYHTNFIHELMVNRVMFSMHLGMRDASAKLISKQTILNDRPSHLPYTLNVKVKGQSKEVTGTIEADGEPFGIDYGGRYFFAPGIEADCGTEPLEPKDYERSSIKKKFCAYLDIIEKGTHRKEWDVPTLYFPFFFPTLSRMESAMELLKDVTSKTPALRRHFLFKVFPTLVTFGKQAPPTGHVFTEPFQRAEHKPFSMAERT
jgi:hypothetical protein